MTTNKLTHQQYMVREELFCCAKLIKPEVYHYASLDIKPLSIAENDTPSNS
jgi:hypothetical protein